MKSYERSPGSHLTGTRMNRVMSTSDSEPDSTVSPFRAASPCYELSSIRTPDEYDPIMSLQRQITALQVQVLQLTNELDDTRKALNETREQVQALLDLQLAPSRSNFFDPVKAFEKLREELLNAVGTLQKPQAL